jgi:ketosteroid isomerase-like protein
VARRSPWARAAYAVERRTYENRYARFMKLHEGKVIDGTAFYDSISNDLWTRVEPRS